MNILQQIWTDSNVFLIFLVNLVHAVALVPVIDHDMVAVGETACVPYIPCVRIGGFVQATACLLSRKVNYSTGSAASFNQIWIDSIGFNFFARIVFV